MAYLFWVHFCFVFFVLQVSQTGSNDDQCLFVVLFFGFKNCVVFLLMQIVSFLSITIRKNSCPDQIKKGFLFVSVFCSIESEGDDANIFVSVFCFYLFDYFGSSKLIFTWLKTSRLLWQLWKGVQSTRTAVLSQIVFFEWIIWWWSLRVFVCLMLTVGVAQPTRLPTPIKGGAFKVRVA